MWLVLSSLFSLSLARAQEPAIRPFAIPNYSVSPNSGSTYGAMPIIVLSDPQTGEMRQMFSMALSWNPTTRYGGVFHWRKSRQKFHAVDVDLGFSSRISRSFELSYKREPL